MFRFSDIRTIAQQIERNGEQSYLAASKAATTPEMAQLFRWMASEERRHGLWFASTFPDQGPLPHEDLEAMGRSLLQDMLAKETFSLDQEKLQLATSVDDFLQQSIAFESDTVLFYEFLLGIIDDARTAAQLREILAEERQHIEQLQQLRAIPSSPQETATTGHQQPAALVAPELLASLQAYREVLWLNPHKKDSADFFSTTSLPLAEVDAARARWQRFRPCLAQLFPETAGHHGLVESPLRSLNAMQQLLSADDCPLPPGRLLLKCDHQLPIAGSVKARGGIHEVLCQAERLALAAGLITPESDYRQFTSAAVRQLLGRHRLAVGSTGNLGLAIGISGRAFGFQVTVHMSADARPWKKNLLRQHGVTVVEHHGDYSQALAQGRKAAAADPWCHFVDDEQSFDLLFGYAAAAQHLRTQLEALAIPVSRQHPLCVYLPCGVGGAPGGITLGLKQLFGEAAFCFFAEPCHAPAMLLGLASQRHAEIAIGDIGLDGRTAADGLAVGRPSQLVGRQLGGLIDGVFTVSDEQLYRHLSQLHDSEQISMEPSALAGMSGPARVVANASRLPASLLDNLAGATHIVWGTGGALVPEEEMAIYLAYGRDLLALR